jgi:hypothetical protein
MPGRNANAKEPFNVVRTRKQIKWADVSRDVLAQFIQTVTDDGCAVVLGRTVNGSALSVCILAGSTKERDYIANLDDVEPIFDSLMAACQVGPYNPYLK